MALSAVAFALVLAVPAVASAQSAPALAGSIADSVTLPGTTSVAIAGHYAYTTGYYAGELTAIDISNPTHPVIAGSSASSTALLNADTVNIAGGYAFVVSKNRNGPSGSNSNDDGSGNSLTILDISTNPAVPRIVGTRTDPLKLFGAYGITVSGNYAYVAAQGCLAGQPCPNTSVGNAFEVVDISNPSTPTIVGTYHNATNLNHVTSVALSGNYAYVTAFNNNRLTVINTSNPVKPTFVTSLIDTTNFQFPSDVAISGHYAYVVDQSNPGRLTVVDISVPSSPVVVGTLVSSALNGGYRIRVYGNFAYVSASSGNDVAIVDISNPLLPRLAASYTDTAHLHKTTGLDVDPTRHYLIASSPLLSTQSQPVYPPYALQSGGPTITGTVSAITLDPVPIGVSIAPSSEPSKSTAQTSASFSFSTTDAVASVVCQLDGGSVGPCSPSATSMQYGALTAGSHTFVVQATDAAGNTATDSYTWTVTPPANVSPPTISGTPTPGQTLTASNGTWTGSPSFSYQWQDCDQSGQNCTAIPGATSQSYTVASSDLGSTVDVVVTATTGAGFAQASSSATAVVTASPQSTSAPAISGTATQGQTLTASPGSWSGYPTPTFSYQWQDCDQSGQNCTPISGATGQSYTLGSADVGSTVAVAVTATNSAGSAQASSPASAVVAPASTSPSNVSPPTISGTTGVGQTLTASPGSWTGSPSFSYQWEDCDQNGQNCNPISGATSQSYKLGSGEAGATVVVVVTATNGGGSAQATSAASGVVTQPPQNTSAPAVSGAAVEGQTLNASAGSWSGYPTPAVSYQWQRCNSGGASCGAIPGATSQSYTALSADVGATLAVVVTGTNSAGSSQASSPVTGVITSAAGPLTPLLDSFNRPNNTGPPGPNWTHMAVSSSSASNNLFITGGKITSPSGSSGDYWNPQAYGPNSEDWITVATKPSVDQDPVVLGLRFQNPALSTASGYQAYYIFRSSVPDQYKITVRTNGATTATLASANGPTLKAGDELLFRAIGTTLELWLQDAGNWTKILSATDGTYQSAGYLNLTARDGTVRLANFGGGTLP